MDQERPSAPTAREAAPTHTSIQVAGITLQHKLLLLSASTTLLVVGCLGIYFPTRQIAALHHELEQKARTYGALVSQQVRSAVAFDDRETARETFDAVAQDPLVDSIVLFLQDGSTLHSFGNASEAAMAAKNGVEETHLFSLSDRILVVAPVQSLEGPRGTLAIELSTRAVQARANEVEQAAAGVGALALLLGTLLSWWIARSIARRMRVVADAAARAAAGDLDQEPIRDTATDEIGVVAQSFNVMLAQLRALFEQIKDTAQKEQTRLESMVAERTKALAVRNEDMRLVLDNVSQGLLTIDREGKVSAERSEALERWLGSTVAPGSTLWDYIAGVSPQLRDAFELGWSEVTEGILPLSLTLEQMPAEFSHNERHFAISYQPIGDDEDNFERMLIVITDVTDELKREQAQQDSREIAQVFSHVLRDRAGFLEFFSETHSALERLRTEGVDISERWRIAHTLKGNAGIFGLRSIVNLCHEIENYLSEHEEDSPELLASLQARWKHLADKLTGLFGDDNVCRIELGDEDYNSILKAVRDGTSHEVIEAMIQAWTLEPTQRRFDRISDQIQALANRLGKTPLEVTTEDHNVRLDSGVFATFWSGLTHVIRNAVDHGIEPQEERIANGKPLPASITLRSLIVDNELRIEVEDNGRGVDWKRIREKAKNLGLAHETDDDLIAALFANGISTKDGVTDISGRGVGMAAARSACEATNGAVRVTSNAGRGTCFSFIWPTTELAGVLVAANQNDGAAPISVGLGSRRSIRPTQGTTTHKKGATA